MKLSAFPYILSLAILNGCTASSGFKKIPNFDGEYVVEKNSYFLTTRKSGPDFMITNKQSMPIFEALDTNDDNTLDLIRYKVFDRNGKYLYTVEDWDMDGSYDVRTNTGNPDLKIEDVYIEINYFGSWYRLVKGESGPIINVDNKEIPISVVNGKPTYNKQRNSDSGAGAPPPVR